MAGFTSESTPKDTNLQRPVGEYALVITKVEEPTSKAGVTYLSLEIEGKSKEGGIESRFFMSFFPNSEKDFPKQNLTNFLTVNGFFQNGKVNIADFNELKGHNFIGIAQYVESEYKGETKKKFEINSFFNMGYRSAGEIAENKDPVNFASALNYVTENPVKPMKASVSKEMPF